MKIPRINNFFILKNEKFFIFFVELKNQMKSYLCGEIFFEKS